MDTKKIISLDENDLLRVEQIILDRDKEEAFVFVKEVIKRQIDKDNASKMRQEGE